MLEDIIKLSKRTMEVLGTGVKKARVTVGAGIMLAALSDGSGLFPIQAGDAGLVESQLLVCD
jgi:hypothetical protein